MVFNKYRILVAIRLALIIGLIFLFLYCIDQHQWYVTSGFVGLLVLATFYELILYSEKYKRDLNSVLGLIRNRDFSSKISTLINTKDDLVSQTINELVQEFTNIRIEKEVHYHYLLAIIDHISVALISYEENGDIQFINRSAKDLLKLENLSNIKFLEKYNSKLHQVITQLKPGKNDLIKTSRNGEIMHLSIHATQFKKSDHTFKLVSLQDIRNELESQELESWQKLIRVLTHEIMNSVTPISSLSEAMNDSLSEINQAEQGDSKTIPQRDFKDLFESIQAIESRSKGLQKFVQNYKDATRIPKPKFEKINLIELLNHCLRLLGNEIKEKNITLSTNIDQSNIYVFADYDLIEQVVINILINAIDAVHESESPKMNIEISDFQSPEIIIKDNGKGIEEKDIDKIFIPFYTTKKEGSGIGLSLSLQIMRLHKGSITIQSKQGIGTTVSIKF